MNGSEYYHRELARSVTRALRSFPVVAVSGPRQGGKTTLIRKEKIMSGRRYFTLDDLNVLDTVKKEPETLLESGDKVTIDEAQRVPELFLAIKRVVDEKRRPGQFLLSGSANFHLLKHLSDSLAGRACYFNLLPFTAREIYRHIDKEPFICSVLKGIPPLKIVTHGKSRFNPEEILMGGFPPAVLLSNNDDRREWFRSYEETYIQRDVRQLSQVADLTVFRSFVRLAALRTGQILNQSDIGRQAGLNAMTASRYLSLLETSCIIYCLPPFRRSRAKRLVKSPKIYLTDSGLAAFLSGVANLSFFGDEPMRGALLETYVAQNLVSTLAVHLPDSRLFYWRIHQGPEVDFIIESGRKLVAIEIKWASRIGRHEANGIKEFMRNYPECCVGLIGYSGTDIIPVGNNIWAVPLPVLWS